MNLTRSNMAHRTLFLFLFLFVMCGIVCFNAAADEKKTLTIYTVNYPLKYFAERIAGDHAVVIFPAPADVDPAFWMPDKETIAAYQGGDLILLNGADYAKWLAKVALSRFRTVDTSTGFSDDYITTAGATTHSHGPGGEHSHTGTAFTTWLDFSLASKQAEAFTIALCKKLPDHCKAFEKKYDILKEELMALDAEIESIVTGKEDRPVVASHPVYQYFSRRYGLNLESVMWEPGEDPGNNLWEELAYGLEAHPARWMIWEGEPLAASKKRLISMGVGSVVFDPCANAPEQGDFKSVMRRNIDNLKEIYVD